MSVKFKWHCGQRYRSLQRSALQPWANIEGNFVNESEKIIAVSEIQALKARYFRMMDTKDWKGLEATFAPDLVADFRYSTSTPDESMLTHGAALYVAKVVPMLDKIITVHHGHMPEIDVTSPTEAVGIWAMEDKLWVQEGSDLPFSWLHGYGHYHERYVQLEDGWRIKEIRLTRLRVDAG